MNRKAIRDFVRRCADGREAPTREELRELAAKALRYEYLRTLNVPQFQTLFEAALKARFDDLVDRAMEPKSTVRPLQGQCPALTPSPILADKSLHYCVLDAGHQGMHRTDGGVSFDRTVGASPK